jgi:peptide-methionine (R)-S-oxide reductase
MPSRRQFFVVAASALGLAPVVAWVGSASPDLDAAATEAFPVHKSEAEWRAQLGPARYRILRGRGTEPAGSSALDHEKRKGTFTCAGCGQPLYASETKFDSGTGWPSFFKPLDQAVGTSVDRSWFMVRTEVHCSRCGGHLGHVFPDGPKPTGLRYCMNGLALTFVPAGAAT